MKTTVWEKRNIVIYVGGDIEKGKPPEITIEIKDPQVQFDSFKNTIYIKETE